MKAITLHQPWATLLAEGAKMVETRSKPWKHRGLVAIHAGRNLSSWHISFHEPFRATLKTAGYLKATEDSAGVTLPLGVIVAVGNMVDCVPTETLTNLSETERAFGNYKPGRFAYVFDSITKLAKPIRWPGHQGMWNLPAIYCDGCDGTGLMEGWNRRDGHPCPKCHGDAIVIEKGAV